ncbi:unnamed protein product [Phyllotreta striolata]|uniref:Fatty acyl-CoA reductase n=1 Tax=Phyllotreta striolata TaxID=444603 RepID=A0A9P0GYQ2_PHYSR|nr:unnamed protein product [Phyllotreta striolata]
MFKPKSPTAIPDFYKGKSVFVTGGSGFVGKVLVEKLLRSCPDIKTIYMLIRPKKSATVEQRLEQIKGNVLFSVLKEAQPKALDKLVPVAGDITKIGLDLSEQDRAMLVKTATIVFHVAASVRFDDFLQAAVFTNLRSTRETVRLVEQLKQVDAFVHVSTAYSNCERKFVEEAFYPGKWDWREAIEVAERMEPEHRLVCERISAKFVEPMPNTYVFTKGLAECLVKDLCSGKFPTCVVRPSIVTACIDEPLTGYLDNFSGSTSLLVAGGTGVARVIKADPNGINDNVFCDNVAKALIMASWETAMRKTTDDIKVYNVTSDLTCTSRELVDIGERILPHYPNRYYIAPMNIGLVKSDYGFYFVNLFCHFFPSLFIDLILKLAGIKVSILRLRRKLVTACLALEPFSVPRGGSWTFVHDNYVELEKSLVDSDRAAFSYSFRCKNKKEMSEAFTRMIIHCKQYLFEYERGEQNLDARRALYAKVKIAYQSVQALAVMYVVYLLVWKTSIPAMFFGRYYNYLVNV